jgi:hypothetical protein
MAWGLDYVATGVVPLDSRHVAVLGLIPDSSNNEVELQVLDRTNGFVVHSDLLALAELNEPVGRNSGRPAKTTTVVVLCGSSHGRRCETEGRERRPTCRIGFGGSQCGCSGSFESEICRLALEIGFGCGAL